MEQTKVSFKHNILRMFYLFIFIRIFLKDEEKHLCTCLKKYPTIIKSSETWNKPKCPLNTIFWESFIYSRRMFSQHDLYTIQDSTLDRCILYGNDHMTASSIMKDPYFWQHQSIIILIIDNLSAGDLRESFCEWD